MKQRFFDPCKGCIENPCPGHNLCPIANAEGIKIPSPPKQKELQIPPNIESVLDKLGIQIPDQGYFSIKLIPTEEGTNIETRLNGKDPESIKIRRKIDNAKLKFRNGTLIKVSA